MLFTKNTQSTVSCFYEPFPSIWSSEYLGVSETYPLQRKGLYSRAVVAMLITSDWVNSFCESVFPVVRVIVHTSFRKIIDQNVSFTKSAPAKVSPSQIWLQKTGINAKIFFFLQANKNTENWMFRAHLCESSTQDNRNRQDRKRNKRDWSKFCVTGDAWFWFTSGGFNISSRHIQHSWAEVHFVTIHTASRVLLLLQNNWPPESGFFLFSWI